MLTPIQVGRSMEPIKSLALAIGMRVVRIASKMPVKPKMPVIGGRPGGESRL
jgi:hypothetical protein